MVLTGQLVPTEYISSLVIYLVVLCRPRRREHLCARLESALPLARASSATGRSRARIAAASSPSPHDATERPLSCPSALRGSARASRDRTLRLLADSASSSLASRLFRLPTARRFSMVGSLFHSDSDSDGAASHSDGSTSTIARSSPFDPLRRPAPRSSAIHAYLSPGRKRLQRRQYLPPSTPKPQASYSHTPWAPERPLAGGSADPDVPLYHRPSYAAQHHGDPDPFLKNKLLVHPVKVLHRPLNDQWAILAKTAPTVNKAAEGLLIHKRPLEVVEWKDLRSHDSEREFLELLFKKDDRGDYFTTPRKKAGEPSSPEHLNRAHELIEQDNSVTRRAHERPSLAHVKSISKKLTLEELSLSDRGLLPIDYFPQIERFLTNEANARCVPRLLLVVSRIKLTLCSRPQRGLHLERAQRRPRRRRAVPPRRLRFGASSRECARWVRHQDPLQRAARPREARRRPWQRVRPSLSSRSALARPLRLSADALHSTGAHSTSPLRSSAGRPPPSPSSVSTSASSR